MSAELTLKECYLSLWVFKINVVCKILFRDHVFPGVLEMRFDKVNPFLKGQD